MQSIQGTGRPLCTGKKEKINGQTGKQEKEGEIEETTLQKGTNC
jgi:hypothetical protein